MSTRFQARTRVPGGIWPGSATGGLGRGRDATEEVALVAQAARPRLLSVHRRRLRFADLEDCYSQSTVELVAQARAGDLRFSSRAHLRNTLELRFVSRIVDRRRALAGRSPAQAMLDGALSLGAVSEREVEIADPRADVERRMLLRLQLRSVERAAHALSHDQRLVLACQIGLQMGADEFCATFGWTLEKHRKVAQRARTRLRELLDEPDRGGAARGEAARDEEEQDEPAQGLQERSGAAQSGAERDAEKSFSESCPVLQTGSGERTGTLL